MNSKMFLQLLFALGFVGSSFACRCLPKTQDERFCEGNFAAIIYVEGRDVVGLERVYNIDIIAILRGNMQQADERHLKGATHSCGVTFEVNKYYVISGYAAAGKPLETYMCQSFKRGFDSNPTGSFQAPTCPAPTF